MHAYYSHNKVGCKDKASDRSSCPEDGSLCAFSPHPAAPKNICPCAAHDATTTIKAHRCILMARSPVFYAMLRANMIEQQQGMLRITGRTERGGGSSVVSLRYFFSTLFLL